MHAFSVCTTALGKDHHHQHHTVQVTILHPITTTTTTTAQAAMHGLQSLQLAQVFTRVLRMWDMSYVNNMASSPPNFYLCILAFVSNRFFGSEQSKHQREEHEPLFTCVCCSWHLSPWRNDCHKQRHENRVIFDVAFQFEAFRETDLLTIIVVYLKAC